MLTKPLYGQNTVSARKYIHDPGRSPPVKPVKRLEVIITVQFVMVAFQFWGAGVAKKARLEHAWAAGIPMRG